MDKVKIKNLSGFLVFAFIMVTAGIVSGAAPLKITPSHMDLKKNPIDCGGCHIGSGVAGTPLLQAKALEVCFLCHGSDRQFKDKKARSKTDIQSLFNKRSRHPIYETGKYHVKGEDLPERLPSTPRHVQCFDCHQAHLSIAEKPWAGSKGYSYNMIRLNLAREEYELCYLCHSDSENLPSSSKNKRREFNAINPSYHPLEAPGKNRNIPSLVRGLNVDSRVTCGSCHGNNDPYGPKGPHGSDYEPLLKAQYNMYDGPENLKAYDLCYSCHDRRSILSDESFKKHKWHIVYKGTSCSTCHTAHGSETNRHLISFNPLVVQPSLKSGGPQYIPSETGMPKCYLNCHNADHNMANIAGASVRQWPW